MAEAIMVRLALMAVNRITRSKVFFHLLEWMSAGMLTIFSIVCFVTAASMQNLTIAPEFSLPSFMSGALISLVNPMHIPFWLGWSTVLMNKGVLRHRPGQYDLYIAGIVLGSFTGFFVFVAGSEFFLKSFQSSHYLINCILGVILLVAAVMQIRKMIYVPAAVRHSKLFRH
jgi:threonine/homoserine/homoserine lactone efflux protein